MNAVDAGGTISTTNYTWGLGTGGVGALLQVAKASGTYFPQYDNNGNIVSYTDENDNIVAEYTYSPFGRIVEQSGSMADKFLHRFSTKQFDSETGLVYYGYRYYSPELGRWLSRDPIGEAGGVNLYGFIGNDPVNYVDMWGLMIGSSIFKAQPNTIDYIGGAQYLANNGYGNTASALAGVGGFIDYLSQNAETDPFQSLVNAGEALLGVGGHISDVYAENGFSAGSGILADEALAAAIYMAQDSIGLHDFQEGLDSCNKLDMLQRAGKVAGGISKLALTAAGGASLWKAGAKSGFLKGLGRKLKALRRARRWRKKGIFLGSGAKKLKVPLDPTLYSKHPTSQLFNSKVASGEYVYVVDQTGSVHIAGARGVIH